MTMWCYVEESSVPWCHLEGIQLFKDTKNKTWTVDLCHEGSCKCAGLGMPAEDEDEMDPDNPLIQKNLGNAVKSWLEMQEHWCEFMIILCGWHLLTNKTDGTHEERCHLMSFVAQFPGTQSTMATNVASGATVTPCPGVGLAWTPAVSTVTDHCHRTTRPQVGQKGSLAELGRAWQSLAPDWRVETAWNSPGWNGQVVRSQAQDFPPSGCSTCSDPWSPVPTTTWGRGRVDACSRPFNSVSICRRKKRAKTGCWWVACAVSIVCFSLGSFLTLAGITNQRLQSLRLQNIWKHLAYGMVQNRYIIFRYFQTNAHEKLHSAHSGESEVTLEILMYLHLIWRLLQESDISWCITKSDCSQIYVTLVCPWEAVGSLLVTRWVVQQLPCNIQHRTCSKVEYTRFRLPCQCRLLPLIAPYCSQGCSPWAASSSSSFAIDVATPYKRSTNFRRRWSLTLGSHNTDPNPCDPS